MISEQGSAFFFLFVALALFAGLSFVFLQGSQGSNAFLSQEQTKNSARQIMGYTTDIERGVKRLMVRGCSPETIEFETANSAAPADKRCSVFDPNGAGLVYSRTPATLLTNQTTAVTGTVLLKVSGIGDTAKTDLIFRMTHLKPEICRQLNVDLLGLAITAAPPQDTFTAAQTDTNISNGIDDTIAVALGDTATSLAGKKAFCYEDTGTNSFDFIKVLVAR